MRNLFRGGFHLTQRISVPGGIGVTQQGFFALVQTNRSLSTAKLLKELALSFCRRENSQRTGTKI